VWVSTYHHRCELNVAKNVLKCIFACSIFADNVVRMTAGERRMTTTPSTSVCKHIGIDCYPSMLQCIWKSPIQTEFTAPLQIIN